MFEFLVMDSADEHENYVKHSYMSLAFVRGILWERAVLDLSKLLYFDPKNKANTKNRERFNLRHFLLKLSRGGIFEKAGIDSGKIITWLSRLDAHDVEILNLIKQRDKKIAHTDSSHKDILNTLTFKNVKDLFEIGYAVVKEINLSVFNRGVSFEPINSPVENLQTVVADLAIRKKQKESAWKQLHR
jgi:hypothetical protein